MKNIQAQYQDLLEGRMSKSNFMRNVRMQFPQHISPSNSFEDSVKILKGKRILSEAQIQELSPELRKRASDAASQDAMSKLAQGDPLGHAKRSRQGSTFNKQIDSETQRKLDALFRDTGYLAMLDKRTRVDGIDRVQLTLVQNRLNNPTADSGLKKITVMIEKNKYTLEPKDTYIDDKTTRKLLSAVKIIQSRELTETLSEAKKPEGVYGHNPNAENDTYRGIDHLNYYQVYHGIQYELAKMPEITDENYVKARKKVVDTILKDPDAYKGLQLANFKAVKEMDKDLEMKDVKKNNLNDKPNEMKVVAKDAKGNTQDTLEKKEAKKAKNGKGLDHMTQTPKGKLEAFATPGKEKVQALKEHILDEMTTQNPHHEDFHKGMEVYKKKGDGTPGKVIEFDGHTATVEWQDGHTEDLQKNILTKIKPEKAEIPMPDKPRTMVQWSNNEGALNEDPVGQQAAGDEEEEASLRATVIKREDRGSMLKKLKERLVKAIKKEAIRKNPNTQAFVATNSPADDSLANQMGYTQTVPGSIQFLGKKKGT